MTSSENNCEIFSVKPRAFSYPVSVPLQMHAIRPEKVFHQKLSQRRRLRKLWSRPLLTGLSFEYAIWPNENVAPWPEIIFYYTKTFVFSLIRILHGSFWCNFFCMLPLLIIRIYDTFFKAICCFSFRVQNLICGKRPFLHFWLPFIFTLITLETRTGFRSRLRGFLVFSSLFRLETFDTWPSLRTFFGNVFFSNDACFTPL